VWQKNTLEKYNKIYIMFKKTNKIKKRTYNKKRTYKNKRKNTYKKKGGGKTPYSRRREPCRYGQSCIRTNPQHFIDFSHPQATNDENNKTFVKDCYDSYQQGKDVFAHLQYGVQFLKEGIDTNVELSLFFHLLRYIVCNICLLVKDYGQVFLSTMLQRFNEESVDISVNMKDVDGTVKECMRNLGIDNINSIEILTALNNPESEFNKKGCVS
jgi:hypothetical protein